MRSKSPVLASTIIALVMLNCISCDKYEPPVEPQADEPPKVELKMIESGDGRALRREENADQDADSQTGGEAVDTVTKSTDQSATDQLPTLDQTLAAKADKEDPDEDVEVEVHTIDIPNSWTRLSPKHEIWVDLNKKQVIAGGFICLNAGPLEVFVCPRQTKEHESVVSINSTAELVHAALLAVEAVPGKPVQWVPEYKPATGDVIEVNVMWKKEEELIKRRGQEMILNVKTGKPMQHDWIFGGSIVETLEANEHYPERSFYLADSGELICVSNFSTATLDVPVKSSDANAGLLYEANTPNVPEVGTKVYVVLSKKK